MTGTVLIGSLIYVLTNFYKKVSGRDWNGVMTQLAAWVTGVVVVVLVVKSGLAPNVPVADTILSHLNGWGQVVAGLLASSLFGVVSDYKQAIDNSDSSKEPTLLQPHVPSPQGSPNNP